MDQRQDRSERIREARAQLSISKAEAARRVGIPYTTYDSYESGHREPDIDMAGKIADALGVSRNYMLYGHTDEDVDWMINKLIEHDARKIADALGVSVSAAYNGLAKAELGEIKAKITKDDICKLADIFGVSVDAFLNGETPFLKRKTPRLMINADLLFLNDEGQRVAADRVHELREIARYTKGASIDDTDE